MNKTPTPKPAAQYMRLGDALTELRADADANHAAKISGKPRGPITGFPRLDAAISNRLSRGLHGIYGNAGAGKTALAMQIGTSCGFPALYVTCEMAPSELLLRHTARITQTYLGRLKSGEMTGEQVVNLALRGAAAAPNFCFLDATRFPASPDRIRECASMARGKEPHVLIVIDSLQSWAETMLSAVADEAAQEAAAKGQPAPRDYGGSEYEILNQGILALRTMAHDLNAPILFISERNRESMKSGGLNAGAGSRKIEYGAESVFDLDRDMNEQPNGAGEHLINLRIPKNRHGIQGVEIPLFFNGALQQFREQTTEEAIGAASKNNAARNGARR